MGVLEGARQPGGHREQGGEEDGEGGRAGCVHDQDPREARDEGRQEGDLRQGLCREGQAGQDGGEGLPCRCPQEERLRRFGCLWASFFAPRLVETHWLGALGTGLLSMRKSCVYRMLWLRRER